MLALIDFWRKATGSGSRCVSSCGLLAGCRKVPDTACALPSASKKCRDDAALKTTVHD